VNGPRAESYGNVLVFEDLYGNLWDLIEASSEKEYVYATAVLKIKDLENKESAVSELKKLRQITKQEKGNISFELKQSKENPSQIIVWECFKNESCFQEHLQSAHLKMFLEKDLFILEHVFQTRDIR
jgi:quinol monooxygenase YgiN